MSRALSLYAKSRLEDKCLSLLLVVYRKRDDNYDFESILKISYLLRHIVILFVCEEKVAVK